MGKDAEAVDATPEREVVSWHALTVDECITKLRCDADLCKAGLSSAQAAEHLEQYGQNKMSEAEKETLCEKIWKQVANVLVCILVIVAVVSAARGIVEQVAVAEPNSTTILTSWVQVGLITTVITVNTIIGIIQEGSTVTRGCGQGQAVG